MKKQSHPHYIGNQWATSTGPEFQSINPSQGTSVWEGPAATSQEVDAAIQAARGALKDWSALPLASREEQLRHYGHELEQASEDLAQAISLEVGKPFWEAKTEVKAMQGKVGLSIQAYAQRCGEFEGGPARTRFKPHGVLGVLGPFNFPGHLPNGHIVPALLAGNTVVFKPSEFAPLVAEKMVEVWVKSGLPAGVLNLVQGGRSTGEALAQHSQIDGLLFTGSATAGLALNRFYAEQPGKMIALEMGGNNPLIVDDIEDIQAAALLTVQSAFLTAGQRCTCARRLIVPRGNQGDQFIEKLTEMIGQIRVGDPWSEPAPFMGPVISSQKAEQLVRQQDEWLSQGAQALVTLRLIQEGTGLVTPGLIEMTSLPQRSDEEVFGPLLQLIRVKDLDQAIEEANATQYGLAAGLLSDSREKYEIFYRGIRAGIVNWNQQLTGASGAAPFGGTGMSGNNRPSAFFAADYCAYPVASIEVPKLQMPENLPVGFKS